jgi:hypothetical protein
LQIINNVFSGTHSYSIGAFTSYGGQIDLDPCTETAAVFGNTFQGGQKGPGDNNTQGIELHGTDLSIVNNVVTNNWDDGIALGGGANIFIANWDGVSSIINNSGNGIAIHQGDPGAYDSERPVDYITINNVQILNNNVGGIVVTGVAPVNHLSITNNCLQGNPAPQINLSDLGSDALVASNATGGCQQK